MKVPGFNLKLNEILRHVFPNVGEQNAQLIDSNGIDYVPGNPGNWPSDNAPTTIGNALDQLSQPGAGSSVSGALGPLSTITFSTGSLSLIKNGNVLLYICGTVTTVSVSNVTAAVQIDGVSIPNINQFWSSGAGASFPFCLVYKPTKLDSTVSHTFGVQLVCGGNMNVSAATPLIVSYLELGG